MKVAIVGGTGFVGSSIARELVTSGHQVSLLVRKGSEHKTPDIEVWRKTSGDIDDSAALDQAVADCDAVVYSVGLLREFPARGITFENAQYLGVVRTADAAIRANARRFVLLSANGVKVPGTAYQETKYRAEQHVSESDLSAVILRPSVIFGDPHGNMEFATQLHRDMVAPPVPAIGFFSGFSPNAGAVRMSPVHVDDVALAACKLLQDSTATGTYELGGPEVLSWTDMVQRIASAVGKRKWVVPMPIALMKLAATVLDRIPAFPVTRDQLTMLAEHNTVEPAVLERLIGRPPKPFSHDNLEYLKGS